MLLIAQAQSTHSHRDTDRAPERGVTYAPSSNKLTIQQSLITLQCTYSPHTPYSSTFVYTLLEQMRRHCLRPSPHTMHRLLNHSVLLSPLARGSHPHPRRGQLTLRRTSINLCKASALTPTIIMAVATTRAYHSLTSNLG